jgi:penicillin G amidase
MVDRDVAARVLKVGGAAALGAAGLTAASAAGAWYKLFRRPLPRTTGEISVKGLDDAVEIRRDRWGMPHIRARTDHDLWFGQGYCHGQDRLWQCESYRRAAAGRLSELAGPSTLPSDKLMRTLGLYRASLREEAGLAPDLRARLEAHCAGLNEAARTARSLPAEFQILRLDWEPWRPADMLAVMKLLTFGLSTNWEAELRRGDMARLLGEELAVRLDPTYPMGNPLVTEPGGQGFSGDGGAIADQIGRVREALGFATGASGSNNWAISAERSATDGPLIAGDPHLSPSMPGIWYTVGLELGDRFCRGASLPGVPGISMGQNNDVCWTFTNVMADVQDLFVERIEGDRYLFEDEWRDLELVEEEIVVKGRDQPLRQTVQITHHGPIVNSALKADDADPLAMAWVGLEHPAVTNANVGILDIRSGPDLVDMLAEMTMPSSNLIWADREGSIGYKTIGRLPLRKGNCPDLPKPGWSGEFEWEGTIPYDELPESVDPDCGYLVTANNRIEPDGYPHHITSEYMDGYRARRIEQMIEAADELDLDQFAGMQTDRFSLPGAEVVKRLARLRPKDQRETRAVEILKSWDGEMTPDSVAASVYHAFVIRLAREFGRAAIRDRDLSERWMDRADNGFLEHQTSTWRWYSHLLALWEEGDEELIGRPWAELVADALRGALDDLEELYGYDESDWRWGRVHRLEFPHALGAANPLFARIFNRTLEPGGGSETVCQVASDPSNPEKAAWAPSWRMVADPIDPARSRWQAFTGQSGQAGSGYYDDVMERWLEGETQLMAGEPPWHTLVLR